MTKKRSVLIFSILILFSTPGVSDVFAHSMFNSAEEFYGGYRVQVATSPEFPQIDEPSQFMIRVTEGFDYEEVDRFTMGIRIFYNDQQIDAILPKSIEGSHWEFDYIWKNSGNHIVLIDLYDMKENGQVLTYTFNMGTQSPFGAIFFAAITVGALALTGVVMYIYVPKIFKKSKP
ncbi:hypothetical protein NKOR_00730 [Candidatus Nitrosopumilus koreensis AR1]|uniref:Uncharacterized protein n=1 Tax=Candidatus Nitrosopumilus koreensis AR1 TaxID=1229908 RepID=K0B3L7_9ARCH|nr:MULTISPECIES: hypothetical protein [Nitrosopumilus]AFS80064.1 hypothetical protein NKOR_00730 [Candidatus Nitrosopumilus koreensis AR1]